MAESGIVIEKKKNLVVVKLERKEACAQCKACVAGLSSKEMLMEADNLCDAQIGDRVNVSLENSSFLKAVLIMYGIPFLSLLGGLAVGYIFFKSEIAAILGGFFLLAICFIIIRLNEKKFNNGNYRPVANEIVQQKNE